MATADQPQLAVLRRSCLLLTQHLVVTRDLRAQLVVDAADALVLGEQALGQFGLQRPEIDAVRGRLELGERELRVRCESNDLARIEVPLTALPRLATPATRERVVSRLREVGFRYVTLDLEGFRSGSLNSLVSVERRRLFTIPEP